MLPQGGSAWRAAEPGRQTIRLLFASAQPLRRIWLEFAESTIERTQEDVLRWVRWSSDGGQSLHEELASAHRMGRLQFFGEFVGLSQARAFAAWLAPLREVEWVVYAKRPFAGPAAVLAYLSRYTHRVAISNQRLLALDERGVTFRWKDYRAKGRTRYKSMTLSAQEFIRRFLLHERMFGTVLFASWRAAQTRELGALSQFRAGRSRINAIEIGTDNFGSPANKTPLCQ